MGDRGEGAIAGTILGDRERLRAGFIVAANNVYLRRSWG